MVSSMGWQLQHRFFIHVCSVTIPQPLVQVSASVRGAPSEVLDVLVNGSSNTTILGPASKVELLGNEDQEEGKEGHVSKAVRLYKDIFC